MSRQATDPVLALATRIFRLLGNRSRSQALNVIGIVQGLIDDHAMIVGNGGRGAQRAERGHVSRKR